MKMLMHTLNKAQDYYEAKIREAERQLKDKIDFDFKIVYQPSDGFVIEDNESGNALLEKCLEIIEDEGRLVHSVFVAICI